MQDLDLPLGRESTYPGEFDPGLLRAIPRARPSDVPPYGADHWRSHEFTWLDAHGRPRMACLDLRIPAASPAFVESKSLKLYLVSFALVRWETDTAVRERIAADLLHICGTAVDVDLRGIDDADTVAASTLGTCIDDVSIDTPDFDPDAARPRVLGGPAIAQRVYTHLVRTLCPVTGQPDYATLVVDCVGPALDRGALLRYVVGFRTTRCFHEQFVERVYLDIQAHCAPEQLVVMGLFCRRGGIDISPVRSSVPWQSRPPRVARQ